MSSSTALTADLLETLGDFTKKDNWDNFFRIRGGDDAFEWYADWPDLHRTLFDHLESISTESVSPQSIQILVPGCGSSRLSEHLYDAGFRGIVNIDFSKVIISDMLRRNIRLRPVMKWRVMDMTCMKFADEYFDTVIDKGGLDALMEPKHGSKLGSKYLKEVKRVLKIGGKFVCLTLAETHVIGLVFSDFRFGWKTSIHAIPKKHKKHGFETFIVVITKDNLGILDPISSSFEHSIDLCLDQGISLSLAIKTENEARHGISSGVADISYSLEDLILGAKGDIKEIFPGRRCQILLGEEGVSLFSYRATLLDSKEKSDAFLYQCGIFMVPQKRACEWLFTSEEGQWLLVNNSEAARLIMVFLDSRHCHAAMEAIQDDLSPLVKHLLPKNCIDEASVPYLTAGDGVKERSIVKKVKSVVTGPILIEDVIYEDENIGNLKSVDPIIFRRLIFERSPGLVQSEGLLIKEHKSADNFDETRRKESNISPKSGKKRNQNKKTSWRKESSISPKSGKKRSQSRKTSFSRNNLKIDHSYLASAYHSGILSGFMLISSSLRNAASSAKMLKTIIIGAGAGLFPMCLHRCLPFLDIEVVELDPVVFEVARDCFEFNEDGKIKMRVADGIKFIQEGDTTSSSRTCIPHDANDKTSHECAHEDTEFKILIIDTDSSDISSGWTCPPAEFLDESFLISVKKFLSGGGLFVINLVSRSTSIREMVIARMKKVFKHLFYLEIDADVNDVMFALPTLPTEAYLDPNHLQEMSTELKELLVFDKPEIKQAIMETAKNIKYLKH